MRGPGGGADGELYTRQSLPQAAGLRLWSCLERPGALAPLAPGPEKGSCWCPQVMHPHAGGKGEGRGRWWEQCSLDTCENSPGRLRRLPAGEPGPCEGLPRPAHLNISVTSPLTRATRTGKPMQAGTRYRRAGCKRTQAGKEVLGRAPARAVPITPALSWARQGQRCPGSPSQSAAGPESGAPSSQTRLLLPGREA